jgi:hypothetical protein
MKNAGRVFVEMTIVVLLLWGLGLGLFTGMGTNNCRYNTYLSKIIFTYFVGCELTRDRTH